MIRTLITADYFKGRSFVLRPELDTAEYRRNAIPAMVSIPIIHYTFNNDFTGEGFDQSDNKYTAKYKFNWKLKSNILSVFSTKDPIEFYVKEEANRITLYLVKIPYIKFSL